MLELKAGSSNKMERHRQSQSNGDVVAMHQKQNNKNIIGSGEETNLDSVVGSTSNISNIFRNPAHTSTPITTTKVQFIPNLFLQENFKKTLVFQSSQKEENSQEILSKQQKDEENNLIKEFSANGFLELNDSQLVGATKTLEIFKPNFVLEKLKYFDKRPIALLLAILLFILGYKMVLITATYVNPDSFSGMSQYAQDKFYEAVDWITTPEVKSKLNPILCGLAVSLFAFFMVYMDSSLPGVYPPSPFSPRSKQIYYRQRTSSIQLSYIMALTSGLIVATFMYFEMY